MKVGIPGRINSKKKHDPDKKNGGAKITTYRVFLVKATSGIQPGSKDFKSIDQLQRFDFVKIRPDSPTRDHWTVGLVPANEEDGTFTMEHETSGSPIDKGIFRLYKNTKHHGQQLLDHGRVMFDTTTSLHEYIGCKEFSAHGHEIHNWEITCTTDFKFVPRPSKAEEQRTLSRANVSSPPLHQNHQEVRKPSPPLPKQVEPVKDGKGELEDDEVPPPQTQRVSSLAVSAATLARFTRPPLFPKTQPVAQAPPAPLPAPKPIAVVPKPEPPKAPVVQQPVAVITDNNPEIVLPLSIMVKVSEVQALEGQPREEFDQNKIAVMADNIIQEGQQAPIIVTPLSGVPGKRWELVDGERRFRGALLSQKEWLEAVVRVFKSKDDQYWASFIANWNREGHTAIETSRAIAKAMASGKTVEQIMTAVGGKSLAWVYTHINLQKLAPILQEQMRKSVPTKHRLRLGMARTLARIPKHEDQIWVWNTAVKEPTPGLINLKLEELASPLVPHVERKQKPAERARRALRIIKSNETDMKFIGKLDATDFKSLVLHKEHGNLSVDLSKRVEKLIEKMQWFREQINKSETTSLG